MNLFDNIVSPYFWVIVINQISISFLIYSLGVPAILAFVFGTFLYLKTKKLSSFYLLLLCYIFAFYAILDLLTWFPNGVVEMWSWSLLDVFSVIFFILSYWFLYSFVKGYDLPFWQKVLTACTLLPTLALTVSSANINAFSAPQVTGLENQIIVPYYAILYSLFILLIIIFSVKEYLKAEDVVSKKKIALAGTGVAVFLFIYLVILVVVGFVISINLFGLASNAYVYKIDLYSLLGMPILLAFLGYLIAKYQAFDVKLIKSIAYMVLLAVILFIGLFFA
ncbi:MAG: hypothetical protein PHS95_03455 [Candidatus Pacebacteria bacterium]|nr:hypothetical protein [Candidatus Paceibacterota bacterium]